MEIIEASTLSATEIQALVSGSPVDATQSENAMGIGTRDLAVSPSFSHVNIAPNAVAPVENIEEEMETIEPIPENNVETALDGDNGVRFSGAPWATKANRLKIALVGAGGIGSWTGLFLSRINPINIDMYDPDSYDTSNMAGQFCTSFCIGRNKVRALKELLMGTSGYYTVNAYTTRIQSNYSDSYNPFNYRDIVIGGLDNMESRKALFAIWKTSSPKGLFIDARLAAEEFQVYCIEPTDNYHIKEYEEKALFSDEEAEHVACSYKQTSHCAAMVGAVITNLVTNYCAKLSSEVDSPEYLKRALPYLTTYDASTMRFKTIMV